VDNHSGSGWCVCVCVYVSVVLSRFVGSLSRLPSPLTRQRSEMTEVWEGPQRPQRRDRPHRGDVRSHCENLWVVVYGKGRTAPQQMPHTAGPADLEPI
jgi:hypothetical protein